MRRADKLFFSTGTATIFSSSILFSIVYLYFGTPSQISNISSHHVSLIIIVFIVIHVLFAMRVLPLVFIGFGRISLGIVPAAFLTCLCANFLATLIRFAVIPAKNNSISEAVFIFLSIMITSLILTSPGWVYYTIKNRTKIIAILRSSGVPISRDDICPVFDDDLQRMLPPAKRGNLLFLWQTVIILRL